MSDSTLLDLELLLGPISEEAAAAATDSEFQRLKDAFDEAQSLVKEAEEKERMGGEDATGRPWRVVPAPDWNAVVELSSRYLQSSHDLRAAAWLTAGLLGTHQLQGLSAGLDLCIGLCESYWADIQPPATEESGHSDTTGGLRNVLSRKSFSSLWATILVSGKLESDRHETRYSYLDYRRSLDFERMDDEEKEKKLEAGYISQEMFRSAALITPPEFLRSNLTLIDECIQKLTHLSTFLEQNCIIDSYDDEPTHPNTREFREELSSMRAVMQQLVTSLPDEPGEENSEQASSQGTGGEAASSKGQMTRESALRTIEQVAVFFEKTEPHSPLHYALRQIVRWGRMPFDKLLIELIDDRGVMQSLRRQIGLPPDEEE